MTKKNVYIFLFDGFSDWEISYLTPELQKSEKLEVKYFSIDSKNIKSMGGLNITPDFSIDQINISQISVLILPGGTAWENDSISEIDKLIEKLNSENKIIGAICAATTYLGKMKILDEIEHTSNDLNYLKAIAPEYKGEKYYQNKLAITDNNVITANGIAPIEFAREVFRKINLYDDENLEKWFQLFKNGIWTK